jgi:hypothetical protein
MKLALMQRLVQPTPGSLEEFIDGKSDLWPAIS